MLLKLVSLEGHRQTKTASSKVKVIMALSIDLSGSRRISYQLLGRSDAAQWCYFEDHRRKGRPAAGRATTDQNGGVWRLSPPSTAAGQTQKMGSLHAHQDGPVCTSCCSAFVARPGQCLLVMCSLSCSSTISVNIRFDGLEPWLARLQAGNLRVCGCICSLGCHQKVPKSGGGA